MMVKYVRPLSVQSKTKVGHRTFSRLRDATSLMTDLQSSYYLHIGQLELCGSEPAWAFKIKPELN